MKNIKVLDCTLRDGGYINDWNFGKNAILDIKEELEKSNTEIIELGFIRDEDKNEDRSIFTSIDEVKKLIKNKLPNREYAIMTEVSNPYPLEKLEPYSEGAPEIIRVIVWKRMLKEGYEYCKGIVEKGYKLCVQPARVSQYSDEEFVEMLNLFSSLNPMAIYVVDSWGTMYKDELLHYLKLADENLKPEIAVGYHGHNNLMQAFEVACAFCEQNLARDLIIDASVYGIGRGAGNLNIELFAKWANEKLEKNYKIEPLIKIYDKYIKKIYNDCEKWGFSIPYLITAKHNSNPNFASYLEKKGLSCEEIGKSISAIPAQERIIFNPEIAKQYANTKIYDNKLAIVVPTKNRANSIIGFLNDYVIDYYNNNIDVIIYDSSDNDKIEKIVNKYNEKYSNIKYKRYEDDVKSKSIDKKYISIIEKYADQYKYLWITRDGLAINISEILPQINKYLDNNYEVIVLDIMERDLNKIGQKEYDCITELFQDCLFQMSVLGATIVRSDVLKNVIEQIPLDDEKNYGMYWPIAYFDCYANTEIKAIKLILTLWRSNYCVTGGSFWHKNFLWQFGERWYKSIMLLPEIYNPYKPNALKFKLSDCEPFSLLFILKVKKHNHLSILEFFKYKTYIKEVCDISLWQIFLIFCLPYFILRPIHKILLKKQKMSKKKFLNNLVNKFLNDEIKEKDIMVFMNKSF